MIYLSQDLAIMYMVAPIIALSIFILVALFSNISGRR